MDSLIQILKQATEKYLADKPVAFVCAFGSRVLDTADSQSDLDIAVGFSGQNISEKQKLKIIDGLGSELSNVLKLPFEKIDIKIFEELPLALRFRIIQQGKTVFVKDLLDYRLKAVNTVAMYHDEKPFFDLSGKAFFERNAALKI